MPIAFTRSSERTCILVFARQRPNERMSGRAEHRARGSGGGLNAQGKFASARLTPIILPFPLARSSPSLFFIFFSFVCVPTILAEE